MKWFVLALLAFAYLGGCAASGVPRALRQEAARAPVDIQAIDQFIDAEMNARHIPGLSLAVVSNGRVLYSKGYGYADLEQRRPVEVDTPFLTASITKMFTATATMMLVERGLVRLDAPIGDFVADIPAHWRLLTVRQLLAHTSGLSSHSDFDEPPCGRASEESDYTRLDVIAEIACLPINFTPGSDWSYSDTGYLLLGLLIERVSGLSYEQYLRQEICMPLGMNATRMLGAAGASDRAAIGYSWVDGDLSPGPALNPVVEGASGGLISTVADLAKFDGALARGDLVLSSTLATMWTPSEVGSARYGLGFGLRPVGGRPQVGHTGGGPSAATSFARFVDDDLTIIILTNVNQPPGTIQRLVAGVAGAAELAN